MKYLDLLHELREAIRQSDDPDPKAAVPVVMAKIPENADRKVLLIHIEELLLHAAPTQAGAVRRETGPAPRPQTHPILRPNPGSSRRARGLQTLRLLSERYPASGGWKYLKDMTAEEILAAADSRRRQADGLHSEADRLQAIADLVKRHGVTVADVPVDELKEYER